MDPRKKLEERVAAISTEIEGIVTAADKDNGGTLTAEQDAKVTTLQTELAEIRTKLEGIKKTEAARAEAAKLHGELKLPGGNPGSKEQRDGIGRIHDTQQDDPKRGFATLGHFALRVFEAGSNPRGDQALITQLAAGTPGMSAGVNSDGGVLIPPAFATAIWDRARTISDSLLGRCDQIPIDPGNSEVTVPAMLETSRKDGNRQGGVRGFWKGELTQLQPSQIKLREVTYKPQELYCFAFVTEKLLRQSPGTAAKLIETGAADEINFKIGNAIIGGTGAGQPVGIVGHKSTIVVSKENAQAAGSIVLDNINKMYSRCHKNWRSGAVWFINQDCEPALEALSAVVGTGGIPVYLPAGGISEAPNARLKGLPVVPIEYCSTVGTVGDIILANLSAYGVASRGIVDSNWSMHLKFDYAQQCFRLIFEIDGQPWLAEPIEPFKGTNKLSPFVTLETRA